MPVLVYNMGTWGLTNQTRSPGCVPPSPSTPYHRHSLVAPHLEHGAISPLSMSPHQRRREFGLVLRMPLDAPAQQAIDYYFADTGDATFRGRPRTTLPTALSADLRRIGRTLCRPTDIDALRLRTQPRTMVTTGAEHSRRIVNTLIFI